MKSPTSTLIAVTLSVFICAQIGFGQAPSPSAKQPVVAAPPKFSPDELDKLVAPVALYPDALISHVLPASTAPVDVVQAARYLKQHGGKIDKTPDKNWNVSVKLLMQFPDALYKLDADLEWMTTLGWAVNAQLDDVMKAIQRVRKLAHAAGNLESNDKQIIVVESEVIRVVPSTSVVYVPTYEPTQVIVVQEKSNDAAVAAVGFAVGVAVGAALADDDCDWHGYGIYHGPYYYGNVNWNDHWRTAAQLPWNPRGVADPRGLYDPRGIADPRGRFDPRGLYDPRGALDPRGRYDPRSPVATPYGAGGVGRAGVGGQAGLGGGVAGQAGVGRGTVGPTGVGGAAGVGRAGAGGQAGAGGGAAGQAGAGRGTAGPSGAGGGGSAFASQRGGASRTGASSARGNQSLSGGGARGGRR